MDKCPVCQREIVKNLPGATAEYAGKTWFFCSDECKRQFELSPPPIAP